MVCGCPDQSLHLSNALPQILYEFVGLFRRRFQRVYQFRFRTVIGKPFPGKISRGPVYFQQDRRTPTIHSCVYIGSGFLSTVGWRVSNVLSFSRELVKKGDLSAGYCSCFSRSTRRRFESPSTLVGGVPDTVLLRH